MTPCNRCRTDNPVGAQFCMKCGASLHAVASPPSAPNGKAPVWIAALAGAALMAAVGLSMSGLLRQQSSPPASGVLAGRADAPTPELLRMESKPQAGVTQRPQSGMPIEIREWLEHLEKVEKQRRDLSLRQIGAFSVTMATLQVAGAMDVLKDLMQDPTQSLPEDAAPSSAEKLHQDVEKSKSDWRALRELFTSRPAPPECGPIASQYEIALRETSGMMIDLLGALERAMSSDDPAAKQEIVGELYAMKGASGSIDKAGRAADGLVGEVCRKYETPKWFDIAGDIGGGGMTMMPGD